MGHPGGGVPHLLSPCRGCPGRGAEQPLALALLGSHGSTRKLMGCPGHRAPDSLAGEKEEGGRNVALRNV